MRNKGCAYLFFAIFAIAGLLCGLLGYYLVQDRNHIMQDGIKTTGRVIDLNHSDNMTAPIVRYEDESGNALHYHSSSYTNIDPYEVGQTVTLYYHPSNPEEVILEGDGWLHLLPFLFLITHGGVGFGGLFWLEKQRRLHQWLQQSGTEVQAQFTGIKEVYNKGRYYSVQCEWTDPLSNQSYVFESEQVSRNPIDQIPASKNIRVLIDPNDPKRYWMDITFMNG